MITNGTVPSIINSIKPIATYNKKYNNKVTIKKTKSDGRGDKIILFYSV